MKDSLRLTVKTLKIAIVVILFPLLTLAVTVEAEMVDKVVAVVNDDVITLSELEAETADLYVTLARNNSPEELQEALEEAREMALNKMIDSRLMEQKAKQFNLTVSEEEIDTAYERMRSRMSLNPAEFRKKLSHSGISEDQYRAKLRENILQSKIVSVDVRSKIAITDEMVLEYYDKHYTSRVNDGDYYLLQIGFNYSGDSSSGSDLTQAHAEKLAGRIHKLATDGQDFKSLAEKFSNLPSAADGGDIGVFKLDEMAPAMREAVKDLQPGQVSPVVELGSTYQFFKLLSGDDEAIVVTSSFEKSKDEIREKLYQLKMQEAYETWVKELKESAYIQKL